MKNSTKLANDLLLKILNAVEIEKQFDNVTQAAILEAISIHLHKIAFRIYPGEFTLSNVIRNLEGELNNDNP